MPKIKLPNTENISQKRGLISISKAAKFLLVSPDTLRNWEKQGKIEVLRTSGGSRRYNLSQLKALKSELSPVKALSLISVGKASKLLQVSKDTIRAWDNKGLIQSVRTKGGARRFSKREITKLQNSLGIDQLLENRVSTQGVLIAKNKKESFRLSRLSLGFSILILIIFFLITGAYYFNSIENNFINESKNILGEKTENLASQIYEIAGAVENLQKSVSNIQSEPEPEIENQYIYIPQTNLEISGVISKDIKPSQSDLLILGSPDSSFKEAYIKKIFGDVFAANNFKLGSIELLNGSEVPEISLGTAGDYYFKKSDASSGLYIKSASGWNSLSNISSLQSAYDTGSEFKTSDNRDIKITLSDSANGSDFSINISGENKFIINDDGSFSDLTPFVVDETGAVGIGTNSPLSRLHLVSDLNILDSDILRLDSQVSGVNNSVFRVDFEGDVFADGVISAAATAITSGNADIAEEYNVLDDSDQGDLVIISEYQNIKKANKPYQKELFGIISTAPGFKLSLKNSEGNLNPKPVALAGRVPVKVSTENGEIEPGDYLTSSSTPGVAMKATVPGQVVGKALESFTADCLTPGVESQKTPGVSPMLCQGKIMIFVNPTFADPAQVLANLVIDEEGSLVIPKLKTAQLIIDVRKMNLQDEMSENPDALDITASLELLKANYLSSEIENAKTVAQLNRLQSKIEDIEKANEKFPYTGKEISQSLKSSDPLDLEPPDELLATPSALPGTSSRGLLTDLKVTENLSSEKLLTTLDVVISGTLKSLGNVFLGTTTIAGDLSVDGTLSVSQNSINALQTLYLQSSPLAEFVDLFNGKVTIDSTGNLKAQSILVADFKVVSNKITGQGVIKKGNKSVNLESPLVEENSRILITPTTETDRVLAVTKKVKSSLFTVSAPGVVEEDLSFDWWMVNEEEGSNESNEK
ncbi:hypothetical protein A3F00_01955 [Candidatus Daviesbacteria bacterium RIFCSPHIGHO2_12_FULL_37_11]|uniref:HTH merR-type domain-containing protein n=1 Tax=Candidatus Daviesbacteria bacterium RIFCSPHIGHO2_12_FULL_37_11 TaxID=1797777 RepID=A0A1F5KDD2_9BACT|nr:MAG: hypothetical protein A2111_03245 [Candidatus Daviesbacteria bacterium GWA1_38_6]OGE17654.1 MAG: hypothetical protein A2769_04050 [Candidatus Daviesbacteria bacterium RIFCSPHIGHO2_01_FULL_37_27]OGE38952.1 MAG: hypothetical protein A3F00_01955 [Candidatus Daviesbacteria bacterium RIFCSPHIGHO2_12_FULL_37_11]OGE46165.1 MAG: hypothetical protein A3B39_02095 [Candidatus Daviesbacteria bacterium RIFCSPLOWO2_01_FULL_37_10]